MPSLPEPQPALDRFPALWTRDFVLLVAGSFLFYVGFQLLLPTMSIFVVDLGGGTGAAGLATGFFMAVAILSRPVAGWALDVYPRATVLVVGIALSTVAILAHQFVGTVVVLLLLRAAHGVGFGVATTAAGTLAADLVPKRRLGEGLGYYGISMGLPLAVAPALGIWLAEGAHFHTLFALAAGCTAVSLVLSMAIKAPRLPRTEARAQSVGSILRDRYEPSAVFPSALMFLLITGFGLILGMLALYGQQRGIRNVGLYFTVYALVLTAARTFAGRLSDRWGFEPMAAGGFAFAAAALVVIAFASNLATLFVAAVLFGIGYGVAQPCLQAMVVQRAPLARRGAATAMLFTAFDLGTALGSVGGGYLAGVLSLSMVFGLTAFVPLVGCVVLVVFLRGHGATRGL